MAVLCQNLFLKNRREKVIENLNLEMANGQITALYGPTESGKTVLLLIFAGLMKPSSGDLVIDGMDVVKNAQKVRCHIGLGAIPSFSPLLTKLTVKENLLLQAQALKVKKRKDRVRELIEWLNIKEEADILIEELPAFIRAKASLALALLNDPTTLLLDEPEYRLTTEETAQFWEFLNALKEKGKCIIISTRYQEIAARCDKTFNIADGKVVDSFESIPMGWVRNKTALA